MPLSHAFQLGALSITVRELTVREVRDWALSVEQGLIEVDPLAFMALEDVSLQEVAVMVNVTAEALEALAPSELTVLTAMCRKLNPHFFSPAGRDPGHGPADAKRGSAAAIERTCLMLAIHGHPQVWDYPYQVYVRAIEVLKSGHKS